MSQVVSISIRLSHLMLIDRNIQTLEFARDSCQLTLAQQADISSTLSILEGIKQEALK